VSSWRRLGVRAALKMLAQWMIAPLWALGGWFVPKDRNRIAINTFPDFDDSTRALSLALRGTGRKLSILTTQRSVGLPSWLDGCDVDAAYRYSVRGIWRYHRARTVFFTHGCYSSWRPSLRQCVVNIWHGMPIKNIGLLDGKKRSELPRFHLTIASDERFQSIIAAAFGVEVERVLLADHPRLDVLRNGSAIRARLPPHRRLAMWLPTYRASNKGDIRVDGDARASIFEGGTDLARIDALCARHGVLCVVKPHPMAKVQKDALAQYRSLMLVDEQWLRASGSSLYEVLGASDLLITDVSSVYFDYRVLDRRVVVFCPDLHEYAASRGFVAPIRDLVSHEIIETECALLEQLEACFAEERAPLPTSVEPTFPASRALLRQVGVL
jgi:CDP-glycerol glycerophosphotransferase (TagB/SpsB family)